jgi:hypothetical protein
MKIRARFTTAVSFWEKVTSYTPGHGNTTTWTLYTEGTMSVFPCEWRGKFGYGRRGNETYEADAEGVIDRASVRMPFIPGLYDKLRTGAVIVIKGADESGLVDCEPDPGNPNVYETYGGIDNILEENQYMEFLVHRYEVMS